MALDVAQQYALRRANRQQHDGIHPHTSYLILKARPLQASWNSLLLCNQHSGRRAQSEPLSETHSCAAALVQNLLWSVLHTLCLQRAALGPEVDDRAGTRPQEIVRDSIARGAGACERAATDWE